MKLLKCIVFVLICSLAKAGSDPVLLAARADFKKTNAVYSAANGMSMDTYYMVFSDHQSQSMIEGKNGAYMKYGGNLYTKIDDIETYAISDKIISINRDNRQITVGDNKPLNLSPLQTDIDTLLTLCETIKVEQVSPDEKKYKMFFNDQGSEFSRIDVLMDTKNSRYLKITLYYARKMNLKQDFYAEEKAPRLEISYKNFRFLEAEPALFNQNLYVLNVDGKLKPAPKYYNFKVSDLRNQTRIKTQPKTK